MGAALSAIGGLQLFQPTAAEPLRLLQRLQQALKLLQVPTLDGRVKLKIPAETQSGKTFRLRGKGVASVRGGPPGDLLCRVVIETPVKLTRRQRELLEEFQKIADSEGKKQSPRKTSWFDGVKKFVDELRT